jgi:hypothetical protein
MALAIHALSVFLVFSFACAFVGAGLGMACSRAWRGEPGSSWALALLGFPATGLFLMLAFALFFGTFSRPLVPDQLRLGAIVLAAGLAIASCSIVRANQAAQAVLAGSFGALFVLVGTVFLAILGGMGTPHWSGPYFAATFVAAAVGFLHGWIASWLTDMEGFFNDARAVPDRLPGERSRTTQPGGAARDVVRAGRAG